VDYQALNTIDDDTLALYPIVDEALQYSCRNKQLKKELSYMIESI